MGRKRAASSKAQATVVLDSHLDISSAGQLRQQLLEVLSGNKPVLLDAANVERVDTAALQVLTAFYKDASAQDVPVQWKDITDSLRYAAQLLDLNQTLNL